MSKGGGGGSSGTVNTQVEPPAYAKPYLEYGLAEAKDRYTSEMPSYYPNSTTVGFSPESEMAMNMQRDRALAGRIKCFSKSLNWWLSKRSNANGSKHVGRG